MELLRGQLAEVAHGSRASLVTLGIVGAIWSSSAAMVAIIDALNHAYDVTERRPWWKRRLAAMALTIALSIFTIVSLTLVLVGPDLASMVTSWVPVGPAADLIGELLAIATDIRRLTHGVAPVAGGIS